MSINSSKLSIQDIYSIVADKLGLTIVDGVEAPTIPRLQFLRGMNLCLSEIGSITQSVERLVLLTPDRRWLRYIKVTVEEANNGIVRIDLEGQKPTLLTATDPDNLDWQYENPCTGDGSDPSYQGMRDLALPIDVTLERAPDSFPKIYLPAECEIPIANYGYWVELTPIVNTIYNLPLGMSERIGGANEPLTPFVVDMKKVGYGSFTVGNADYPTTATPNRYFIDPFLICCLRLIQYTGVAINYNIPYSADAYLNQTWAQILGMVGVGTALERGTGANTFVLDGVTYTVTIDPILLNWSVPADTAFRILLTDGLYTWYYDILPSLTPWQTVGTDCDRWGRNFFGGQALWSNRAWYVKLNDFVLRLPDDFLRCKWLWKVPTDSMGWDLPEDPAADVLTEAMADTESLMYSRLDEAYHYFPITETRFTQLKYLETQGYSFNGEGFYIQTGQQLRIVPRPVDLKSAVIAMLYEAKPDNIALTTAMADFDTTFLELPSEAVNVIIYMILAGLHLSSRAKDIDAADRYERKAQMALAELKRLYGGRQGQQADAPVIDQTLDPNRNLRSFGFGRTRGGRRF